MVDGYHVLHDNWVTEFNEVLYDEEGNEYIVKDFKSNELATAINTNIPPQVPAARLAWLKHSAVKLSGHVKIGDALDTQVVFSGI